MTNYSTDTRLLTWASTPWNRRRLLRVSPVGTQTFRLPQRGALGRLADRARHHAVLVMGLLGKGWGGKPHNSPSEPDGGCAICRSAQFEIGAVSAGQEYL